MNTYWVYENIRKQASFYNQLDVLLLICSGYLYKKNNPDSPTTLFTDSLTFKLLEDLQVNYVWDNIQLLPENKSIEKSIFWAAGKVQILRDITAPTLILDHDVLIYKNIEQHLNEDIVVAHDEDGKNYYPTAYDPFIRQVQDIIPRPSSKSINCSFCYYPDYKFANSYSKLSLELMERFTKAKVPSSKYLIFAEQLALKYLIDYHNIPYKTLIKGVWKCTDLKFEPTDNGIYSLDEVGTAYRHYWMDKSKIKENKEGADAKAEIRILHNILSPLKNDKIGKFNDIKSRLHI